MVENDKWKNMTGKKSDKQQKLTSDQKWQVTVDKGKMRNDKWCDICPINSCYIALVRNSSPSPL